MKMSEKFSFLLQMSEESAKEKEQNRREISKIQNLKKLARTGRPFLNPVDR